MHWVIVDDVGLIPKDNLETPPYGTMQALALPLWYSKRYNLSTKFEDIAPMMDFTCTRCLEPGPSGPELNAVNRATTGPSVKDEICTA